jgi:hypothetical protein
MVGAESENCPQCVVRQKETIGCTELPANGWRKTRKQSEHSNLRGLEQAWKLALQNLLATVSRRLIWTAIVTGSEVQWKEDERNKTNSNKSVQTLARALFHFILISVKGGSERLNNLSVVTQLACQNLTFLLPQRSQQTPNSTCWLWVYGGTSFKFSKFI